MRNRAEREFETATAAGLPRLIFLLDENSVGTGELLIESARVSSNDREMSRP
jgi:hypothetical protein